MKSKNIITGVGMLFCLAFFNLPDAAGQDCGLVHPFLAAECWEKKARNGEKDLTNARMWCGSLAGADLSGANLTNAFLVKADLRFANLTKANLTNANLTMADFRGANMRGADFTKANLIGVIIGPPADYYNAILTGAFVHRSLNKGIDFEEWKRRGAIVRD